MIDLLGPCHVGCITSVSNYFGIEKADIYYCQDRPSGLCVESAWAETNSEFIFGLIKLSHHDPCERDQEQIRSMLVQLSLRAFTRHGMAVFTRVLLNEMVR